MCFLFIIFLLVNSPFLSLRPSATCPLWWSAWRRLLTSAASARTRTARMMSDSDHHYLDIFRTLYKLYILIYIYIHIFSSYTYIYIYWEHNLHHLRDIPKPTLTFEGRHCDPHDWMPQFLRQAFWQPDLLLSSHPFFHAFHRLTTYFLFSFEQSSGHLWLRSASSARPPLMCCFATYFATCKIPLVSWPVSFEGSWHLQHVLGCWAHLVSGKMQVHTCIVSAACSFDLESSCLTSPRISMSDKSCLAVHSWEN